MKKIKLKSIIICIVILILSTFCGYILLNSTFKKENSTNEGETKKITELLEYSEAEEGVPEQEDEILQYSTENIQTTENESIEDTEIPESWDATKVYVAIDSTGIKVPVPIGYTASGADSEKTVKTGFVIYEGTDEVTTENAWEQSKIRNQWVWIPVPDPTRLYTVDSKSRKKTAKLYTYSKLATERELISNNNYEPGIVLNYDNERVFETNGMLKMTKDKLLKELQTEFEATIESIEKYGGYYIGRYETSRIETKKPIVQRMTYSSYDNENITWYNAYRKSKNIGTNDKIKTGLIWGCLWDETLQWLIDTENKTYDEITKDSSSWGNYINSTFDVYIEEDDVTETKKNAWKIPTGSTEYTKANNIYDLAGNLREWTIEGREKGRITRGGSYTYDQYGTSSAYRNYNSPIGWDGDIRCACVLVHKINS